ncbi:MAG: hypothetical protein JWM88_1419 [Verrucomicrobia bacterium]|nr:hypothetical protein [Verrucomicrobiota bacterium]
MIPTAKIAKGAKDRAGIFFALVAFFAVNSLQP